MSMRLQKRLAQAGVASRRKAEDLIRQGLVKVNGEIITEMGYLVDFQDVIEVHGVIIEKEDLQYYVLNKPSKVISSAKDDRNRTTVIDLINDPHHRLFPVGRLDYYSTGLILITNDGEFANLLTHPSSHITKQYHVRVEGLLSPQAISQVRNGLETPEVDYLPAKLFNIKPDPKRNYTHFDMEIIEGKNRQIRKMFSFLGFEVQKLHRQQIGPLTLEKLQPGQFRKLKPYEIKQLERAATVR